MATTYLTPGVYVEDIDRGPKPIEGVTTAVAAFVGFSSRGPVNEPTLVSSWTQFVDTFGEHQPGAFLPQSIHGFFGNGGENCYVLRLPIREDDGESAELGLDRAAVELPGRKLGFGPSLVVTAKPAGEVGASIVVEVREGDQDTFTLIARLGGEEEYFSDVALGMHGDTTVGTVSEFSKLVQIEVLESSAEPQDRVPVAGTYYLAMPAASALEKVSVNAATFRGDASERKGVGGLEAIEEINLVCAPDLMTAYLGGAIDGDGLIAAQMAMIAHCEQMGDRMAILDAPPDLTPQEIARWRRDVAGYNSKYAALYYPWIEVIDTEGKLLRLPPSGHVAGIYARVDTERGVHKAPANESVRGAVGTDMPVTNGEQELLNPMGVNCIREFPGRGIRVWGARLLSSEPDWRYVNVRRLMNYFEESIREGTQWVAFEPNDTFLWEQVTRDVSSFLRAEWRRGALLGDSPEQAYYVKCDEELNPAAIRDQGQMLVEVGVAPVKPAEFIIFRINQWAAGAVGGL